MNRKNFIISVVLATVLVLTFPLTAQEENSTGSGEGETGGRLALSIHGLYLLPHDANYRKTYGTGQFVPEVRVRLNFSPRLYGWFRGATFSASGEIKPLELEEETRSSQHRLTAGLGFRPVMGESLALQLEAGGLMAIYSEEALGEDISGSTPGFRGSIGLSWRFAPRFMMILEGFYSTASDSREVKDKAGYVLETVEYRVGGAGISLGIGLEL